MTREEFYKKFKGVNTKQCLGAKPLRFNPSKVNESAFPDELRYKEYEFDFKEGDSHTQDAVEVSWVSQSWETRDRFFAEVRRCLTHIGFVGVVDVNIRMRGESWGGHYGDHMRFTIAEGEKNDNH